MNFGLYEHFVVGTAIFLILTRNTRFFYLCVLVIAISQWAGIDYLRTKQPEIEQCSKYSVNLLGKIFEWCVSVKKQSESE